MVGGGMKGVWAGVAVVAGVALAAPAWAGSVKASSELTDSDGVRHPAELAVDGLLSTAWAEGVPGPGGGAWLEIRLDGPTDIAAISIWPGDLSEGVRSLKEKGRPSLITVELDGVVDALGEPVQAQGRVRDVNDYGIQRIDIPIEGRTSVVRVRIDEADSGFLASDVYVAEVAVNLVAGDAPPTVAAVSTWEASPKAERERTRHRDDVVALFDAIDAAEFGDRDKLAVLMDYVRDGAPFLRRQVARTVPVGFRVAALPPDAVAVEALLKLKDANAIPALSTGATRLTGAAERELRAKVSLFEAYAELQGGPRRNLPTWGTTGWEDGALRGFGEPADVALSVFGDLYVADTGNHRVSVFGPSGAVRGTFGVGKPSIQTAWFRKGRAHYVSGREASDKPGGFTNPVAVATLPVGEGEVLGVLDAMGFVSLLSAEGAVQSRFKVRADGGISPGVDGEAHLLLTSGKVVVVWGNEVITYDLDGDELSRWSIEGGVPLTALLIKGGKLLLGFRSGVAQYTADGFRQATVIDDELPAGFEAYDLAADEKGKVWAITDNGWAVKFKKPGKVDYAVRWSERGGRVPRAAVREDYLWITTGDRIVRLDALEAKKKAELAEAE